MMSTNLPLKMDAPVAIALTWDSNTVRVKCPYSCSRETHSHGFTSPKSGRSNTRAAHCTPQINDSGDRNFSPDYRLVFPFEEDPETEGMWWAIDYQRTRWRTISWRIYDSEYWENCSDPEAQTVENTQNELGVRTAAEEVTDITHALSGLTVNGPEAQIDDDMRNEPESQTALEDITDDMSAPSIITPRTPQVRDQRHEMFCSLCVCNSIEEVRRILAKTADAHTLVNRNTTFGGQPLLLAVVEEGHDEIVDILLQHGAYLESKDGYGNTALLRALHFGRGLLAERLISAGADIDATNNDSETVSKKARASLEDQKESIRFESLMIHPREPPLIEVEFDKTRIQKNIDARMKEVCALQRIIASYEQKQARKQFLLQLRQISEMYGEEQAIFVEQNGELDDRTLLVRLLDRIADTPRATEWKTVACLARGTALPWSFAVSGYSSSTPDGALHRPTWNNRVFDLARLIGHNLPADYRDGNERVGSFYACHAEKQLLAYFVWNHATALCSDNERYLDTLRQSEAGSLSKLHAEIYVCQPGRDTANVCDDCYTFCQRTVLRFGFRATLKRVSQGNHTSIEFPHP